MKIAVIGGLGRMGLRHCSTLTSLGYCYDVYDTKVGNEDKIKYADYDFFIIATPTNTHAEIFRKINKRNDKAKILIEKPVVDKWADLDITDHPRVFCGMIRRFDPLTNKLYRLTECNIIHAYWRKSGLAPAGLSDKDALLDLGIHIIDTWQHLGLKTNILEYHANYSWNTYDAVTLFCKDNSVKLFDYNNRTHEEYYEPLKNELKAFFNYKTCHAEESHRLCLI